MSLTQRLTDLVTQGETDTDKLHDMIHGDDTTEVSTDNGNVPSIAKSIEDNFVNNGTLAAAQAARDKAQDWAEELEDTEVETGQFSALHHAAKALASANSAALVSEAGIIRRNLRNKLIGPIRFDGVTGKFQQSQSIGAIGTNDFSLIVTFRRTGYNNNSSVPFMGLSLNADDFASHRITFAGQSNLGTLQLRNYDGSTTPSNVDIGSSTDYFDKVVTLMITRTGGTIKIYDEDGGGRLVVTDNTAYNANIDFSTGCYFHIDGDFEGELYDVQFINRELSLTDWQDYLTSGLSYTDSLELSETLRNTASPQDSSGRPMDTFTGLSATGATFTKTQTSLDARFGWRISSIKPRHRYVIMGTFTRNSGVSPDIELRESSIDSSFKKTLQSNMPTGSFRVEFVSDYELSNPTISFIWGVAEQVDGDIANLEIYDLGRAFDYKFHRGIQALDLSSKRNHAILTSGTYPMSGDIEPYVDTLTWSAESTAKVIVSANDLWESAHLIKRISLKSDATVTVDLGDGFDVDYYQAGEALTANTWLDLYPADLLKARNDGTNLQFTVKPTATFTGSIEVEVEYGGRF